MIVISCDANQRKEGMKQKHLSKEKLGNLLIGNNDPPMNSEIIETEEVKSMMYHQWKNPQEVHAAEKPNLKKLFEKIKQKTHSESAVTSPAAQFLIAEVEDIKSKYRSLRSRFIISLSAAAAIALVIATSSLIIIQRNHVFKKLYTENIVPKGQKSNLILPDGTRVFLNSGSVIRYDNSFGKKYRKLELSGEAYFEVTHNEKLPFIINTADVEVKVIGTKFDVIAYPGDETVETIVTEGKVSVTELHNQSSLMLSANQKATFNKDTRLLMLNYVNPDLYISWKNDLLTFDNENFANVIKKLERWYDVKIHVEGTDSIRDRFTMTIKSESLREVLDLISLTTNIEYSVDANQVTITYK